MNSSGALCLAVTRLGIPSLTTVSVFIIQIFSSFQLLSDCAGDIGDKFFVVYDGAVEIRLPDPEIPPGEFEERYAEFKLLERELEERKELERKKELVELRKKKIEELMQQKKDLAHKARLPANLLKMAQHIVKTTSERKPELSHAILYSKTNVWKGKALKRGGTLMTPMVKPIQAKREMKP